MILVPSIKRIAARVTAAAMAAVTLMTSVAYADEPYDGYNLSLIHISEPARPY